MEYFCTDGKIIKSIGITITFLEGYAISCLKVIPYFDVEDFWGQIV